MNPYQVIKTVSVTEKSTDLMGEAKYTFIVHPEAGKHAIKAAVEDLFDREVASVNVMNRLGKKKRTRHGVGKKADWKKAVVTLKPGQEPIDIL